MSQVVAKRLFHQPSGYFITKWRFRWLASITLYDIERLADAGA